MLKKIILLLLIISVTFAEDNATQKNKNIKAMIKQREKIILQKKKEELLNEQIVLKKEMHQENIWTKIYSNYKTYLELKNEYKDTERDIKRLESKRRLTSKQDKQLDALKIKEKTLKGKLELLVEYEDDPFSKLLKHDEFEDIPIIGNPIAVLGAISYQKKLTINQEEYKYKYDSLTQIVVKLMGEKEILTQLSKIDDNEIYKTELKEINSQLDVFNPLLEIFTTTKKIYDKKIDEIKLNLSNEIKREVQKTLLTLSILIAFIIFLFILKFITRKYIKDDDRTYRVNKALNMTFITILLLTLLFTYIENVSYLVTVLGFASAGIAIAMKDWFMSIMGWLVLIMGGSMKIGDRVKFVRGNIQYVGDIVDISLLRMTLQEDITLTTYNINRRAGRFIFIPNNFIFTDMIANYSHSSLKTVWDGIDFVVTFDSDINKTISIVTEVTKKYSKGYTDITRKQLNGLRTEYSLKNTNVEPRIFSFFDTYGVKISSWYMTNSYATLKLRSTISMEIMERIKDEKNISMAFPTQTVYIDKNVKTSSTIDTKNKEYIKEENIE